MEINVLSVKRSDSNSTLLRAFAILEAVATADRPSSVAEIVERLDLPKPTAHRLTQRLIQEGLLQRDPASKRLIPGGRLGQLALHVLASSTLLAPRRAILKTLSEQLEETCNLCVLDGEESIYLDRVETNWPIRIQLPVGSRMPLHCTASGKLFLARMPQRQRSALLQHKPLLRNTPHTITDPEVLERELQRIVEEGISTDNEELMSGMVAIALPVTDRTGRICATVAVHAPTVRKSLTELRQQVPAVNRAATALTQLFQAEAENFAGDD